MIEDLLRGSIGARAFADQFGNLYYQFALDGHEGNVAQSDRSRLAVRILERVQLEAVDLLIPPDANVEEYVRHGRLPIEQLRPRVAELVSLAALEWATGVTPR